MLEPQPHHSFDVEHEQPSPGKLALYGLALVVALAVSGTVLTQIFYQTVDAAIYAKVLEPPSPELLALRAHEEDVLKNYGWVDQQKGVVRIPIEEAMKRVVAEEGAKK